MAAARFAGDRGGELCVSDYPVFKPEIKLLRETLNTLADVESRYEDSALALGASRDRDLIQEVFHVATHEAATTIGFALNDIETLIQRLEIRAAHSDFTPDQFQFIVATPWSTTMIAQLLAQLGDDSDHSLATLSPVVKEIQGKWNALRRLNSSYGFPDA